MSTTDTTEKAFEEQIEAALLADGFFKGAPHDFDKAFALDPRYASLPCRISEHPTERPLP